MAVQKLDLFDVSSGPDGPRLGSVTLDGGKLVYEGTLAQQILKGWLRQNSPAEVIDKFNGYSNGAVAFREAKV